MFAIFETCINPKYSLMAIYMQIGILSQIPKVLTPSSTVVSTVVAMCVEQLTLNVYGVHT